MKLSIIIPTFNRRELLASALESALQDSQLDLEVLVVDDGSSDDTEHFIAGLKTRLAQSDRKSTLKYLRQPNQGAPVARNLGVEHATGDFILFMDSDDLPSMEGLQAVMAQAEKGDADYLHAKVQVVDDRGRPLQRPPIGDEYEDSGHGLMAYTWHTMGAVYSRKCVERVGPWATSLIGSQDWEYQVRVKLLGGKGVFVDAVVGYWRQHDNQRLGTKTFRPEYVKSVQEACKLIIANAEKANRCDEVLRTRIAKRLLVHAAEWGAHGFTNDNLECLKLAENISQKRLFFTAACSLLRISPRWCARLLTSVLAAQRGG